MNINTLMQFCSSLTQFSLLLAILLLFVVTILTLYFSKGGVVNLSKNSNLVYVTKFVLVLELAVFFILNLMIFFIFVRLLKLNLIDSLISKTNNFSYQNYTIPINLFSFELSIDIIGLIFSNLAFFVGFLSLLCLDTRFY
jgi:hypothetical protein